MSQSYRGVCFNAHGRECVVCGTTENLIAHHVDGDRTNNDSENLRPMCRGCHRSVHHGADETWSPKLPERAIIENHATELRPYEYEPLKVLADGRANPYLRREETGLGKGDVNTVLNRLARAGLVRQVTRGLYEITDDGRREVADA